MIHMTGVEKRFGQRNALDGLNLEVKKGALYGLIGPNGAGKTTTLRLLAGVILPDEGKMELDGLSYEKKREKLKRRIGYMPDHFGVYDNLRVMEYMEFFADVYEIPIRKQRTKIEGLLEMVHLEGRSGELVDTLPRGMKQKLSLARTLIHSPRVLLLDEPASGMEPMARLELREILKSLTEQEMTIVVSSHILPEMSELCTNFGILENGKLLFEGTKEEMLRQASKNFPIKIQVTENSEEAVKTLKVHPLVKNITRDGNTISAMIEGNGAEDAELLRYLIQSGISVAAFQRQEGSLEHLFLRLTEGKERKRGKLE